MSVSNGVETAAAALREVLADLQAQVKTIQASLDLLESVGSKNSSSKLVFPTILRTGTAPTESPASARSAYANALIQMAPAKPSTVQLIADVLRESAGTPLHVDEIWSRAKALGASSGSPDIQRIVYNNIQSLIKERGLPIVKVPDVNQTYVWINEGAQAAT